MNSTTELGDLLHLAFDRIGITEDRVKDVGRYLGVNEMSCGCSRRREKLNLLSAWARRVLRGKLHRAAEHLSNLLGE